MTTSVPPDSSTTQSMVPRRSPATSVRTMCSPSPGLCPGAGTTPADSPRAFRGPAPVPVTRPPAARPGSLPASDI
ncbi:hypothetical protein ACFFX0_07025 [Citricoccus parietis]|uniref:Uncharacterized protein n=1 Tax=Citricoccus parietis TaxID=592307 RepID=A0ABV5FW99_9MICC